MLREGEELAVGCIRYGYERGQTGLGVFAGGIDLQQNIKWGIPGCGEAFVQAVRSLLGGNGLDAV